MRPFLLALFLLCTFPVGLAFAQAAEEDESYSREFTYGINFNSNGGLIGGLMIKQVYHLNGKWYHFWGLEGVEVKHPKETRYQNPRSGGSYIRGKSNYLFVLRPQYGREYTFFKKAAESGVQVNGIIAAGPSIGFLAPYYIEFDYSNYGNNWNLQGPLDIRTEQFDPDKHEKRIDNPDLRTLNGVGVFQGLSEPNLRFGGNIKAGVSFEYGRYMESVTGIEVGVLYEAFAGDLTMIPAGENRRHFTSFYLTLYYGHRR